MRQIQCGSNSTQAVEKWQCPAFRTHKDVLSWKNVEKYGKTAVFSGLLRPDWGNTARAAAAGLGFIGLKLLTGVLANNMRMISKMNTGSKSRLPKYNYYFHTCGYSGLCMLGTCYCPHNVNSACSCRAYQKTRVPFFRNHSIKLDFYPTDLSL